MEELNAELEALKEEVAVLKTELAAKNKEQSTIFQGVLGFALIVVSHVILFWNYKGSDLTYTQSALVLFDFFVGMYYFFPSSLKEAIAHANPLIRNNRR